MKRAAKRGFVGLIDLNHDLLFVYFYWLRALDYHGPGNGSMELWLPLVGMAQRQAFALMDLIQLGDQLFCRLEKGEGQDFVFQSVSVETYRTAWRGQHRMTDWVDQVAENAYGSITFSPGYDKHRWLVVWQECFGEPDGEFG